MANIIYAIFVILHIFCLTLPLKVKRTSKEQMHMYMYISICTCIYTYTYMRCNQGFAVIYDYYAYARCFIMLYLLPPYIVFYLC